MNYWIAVCAWPKSWELSQCDFKFKRTHMIESLAHINHGLIQCIMCLVEELRPPKIRCQMRAWFFMLSFATGFSCHAHVPGQNHHNHFLWFKFWEWITWNQVRHMSTKSWYNISCGWYWHWGLKQDEYIDFSWFCDRVPCALCLIKILAVISMWLKFQEEPHKRLGKCLQWPETMFPVIGCGFEDSNQVCFDFSI